MTRAVAVDGRVMADARRLHRVWRKGKVPPAHWTLRWTGTAVDVFLAWAGSERVVSLRGGGVRVQWARLAKNTGHADALERALSRFVRDHAPALAEGADRMGVLSMPWSDNVRRWIEMAFPSDRPMTDEERAETLTVARALELVWPRRETWHVSILGARCGGASKVFRSGTTGRRRLADALLFLAERSGRSEQDRESVLEEWGVVGSPTAYGVVAAGLFSIDGLDFPARLAEKNEAVSLTLQNLHNVQVLGASRSVLTIENEAPFLDAIQEGLHRDRTLVLTGGYPNRAVHSLLQGLLAGGGVWNHWGDTDLAGVRIARVLADRAGKSPLLFRSSTEDLRRLRNRLIKLNAEEKEDIACDVRRFPTAVGADVLRTVLQEGGWLEQESWSSA